MKNSTELNKEFTENGFVVLEPVFSEQEVSAIIQTLTQADTSPAPFRKTADLFAIRQFLKEVPQLVPLIFTEKLCARISSLPGKDYFVVKSIYFDKPAASNWFVSYHQDLTISVDRKADLEGFGSWTVKQNQFAVQPPLAVLEKNFTLRIHLDETGAENGALKVIPKSHLKGIYRPETIDWSQEKEVVCSVPKGGIMLMRPLLLHASGRTTNQQQRRVIHMEFSNQTLPYPLDWSERLVTEDFRQQ